MSLLNTGSSKLSVYSFWNHWIITYENWTLNYGIKAISYISNDTIIRKFSNTFKWLIKIYVKQTCLLSELYFTLALSSQALARLCKYLFDHTKYLRILSLGSFNWYVILWKKKITTKCTLSLNHSGVITIEISLTIYLFHKLNNSK